jgi:hypothetical protein
MTHAAAATSTQTSQPQAAEEAAREEAAVAPPQGILKEPGKAASQLRAPLQIENRDRDKTLGEYAFNTGAYGGFALVGNEVLSTFISKSIESGRPADTYYQRFSSWFEKLGKFKNAEGKPFFSKYIHDAQAHTSGPGARLPYLIVATFGGMFMVPFIKYCEDRKGSIVRWFDRKIYGSKADTDPQMVEAHKEMDEAPKQTWGSLAKGRVATVFFAALGDYAFGWKDALTARLFKGTRLENYASLDALANRTAEFSQKKWNFSANAAGWVKLSTWLLTLSTTLTVLFYATSKLFARRRDERMEHKQRGGNPAHPLREGEDDAAQTVQNDQETAQKAAKPSNTIAQAAREETIIPAQSLAAQPA